jgi:hypothetical protein
MISDPVFGDVPVQGNPPVITFFNVSQIVTLFSNGLWAMVAYDRRARIEQEVDFLRGTVDGQIHSVPGPCYRPARAGGLQPGDPPRIRSRRSP